MVQAQQLIRDASSPFSYTPVQTILLILDYHTLFVKQISARSAAEKAIALKRWAQAQRIPLAHALLDASSDAHPPAWVKGRDRVEKVFSLLKVSSEMYDEPPGLKAEGVDSEEMVLRRAPGYVSALTSHLPVKMKDWLEEREIKGLICAD